LNAAVGGAVRPPPAAPQSVGEEADSPSGGGILNLAIAATVILAVGAGICYAACKAPRKERGELDLGEAIPFNRDIPLGPYRDPADDLSKQGFSKV
jgi:aspartyl aminopeptidase